MLANRERERGREREEFVDWLRKFYDLSLRVH